MKKVDEKILTRDFGVENSHTLDVYRKQGGYEALSKALKKLKPEDILSEVKAAHLRGRGGAGFPAGMKWDFIPKDSEKPRYLCVNADEGEPGTFKDRYIMSHAPHLLIEGILLTCYCVGIKTAFIYIRGEYENVARRLESALEEAREAGLCGKAILGSDFECDMIVHRGAGAYICGEETALLESLEGKRGNPRLKPPFPAAVGLFQCPTVINNVETLSNIPSIVLQGGKWFSSRGIQEDGGTRIFGVSGFVAKPGIYELPVGTPLKDIIFTHAGGMLEGKTLKAVIPGGMSAPVLKADEIDVTMDCHCMLEADSMLGSSAVIVIDQDTSMLDVLRIMIKFYSHESCGQCTPCRIGTSWIYKIVQRMCRGKGRREEIDEISRLASNILGKTLCPMGDAAAMPILSIVAKFRGELEETIVERSQKAKIQ